MFRPFTAINGNKDVVSALEEALEEARAGRLVGIVLCGLYGEEIGWGWAHKTGLPYPWPRLLSSVADAHHELTREGPVE